jgi:hypothetical protein
VAAEGDPALDAPVEAQILGIGSEDRPMADLAAFAQGHPAHQLGMPADGASPSDPDPRLNDRQGTDLDVFAEFCARINDGGRVDFQTNRVEQGRVGNPTGGSRNLRKSEQHHKGNPPPDTTSIIATTGIPIRKG